MHQPVTSNESNSININKLKYYLSIKLDFATVLYILVMGASLHNFFMLLHLYNTLPNWLTVISLALIILTIVVLFKYKGILGVEQCETKLEQRKFIKYGGFLFILSSIAAIQIFSVSWDVLKTLHS